VILKGQFLVSKLQRSCGRKWLRQKQQQLHHKMSKKVAQPPLDKVAIEEIDDLDEEEPYDSDLDELGW
jgi:hypothetical protein